jgi:hypothetical protein
MIGKRITNLTPSPYNSHQSGWNFPLRVVFYEETTPSYRWQTPLVRLLQPSTATLFFSEIFLSQKLMLGKNVWGFINFPYHYFPLVDGLCFLLFLL